VVLIPGGTLARASAGARLSGFLATVCAAPALALAAGAALPRQVTSVLPLGTGSPSVVAPRRGWLCFTSRPRSSGVLRRRLAAREHRRDYDPRNAIVAAWPAALAVPIIAFAIAEESLSNVPGTLSAPPSLGATRWQRSRG
jgi:hypothetical protein